MSHELPLLMSSHLISTPPILALITIASECRETIPSIAFSMKVICFENFGLDKSVTTRFTDLAYLFLPDWEIPSVVGPPGMLWITLVGGSIQIGWPLDPSYGSFSRVFSLSVFRGALVSNLFKCPLAMSFSILSFRW